MSQSSSLDKVLQNLTSKDFDGHTEFDKLTNEEKLAWLSNMAQFLWQAKQERE